MMFTLSIMAIVLGYTWVLAPMLPRSAAAIPVVLVVGLSIAHAIRTREWGLDRRAFLPGLRSALAVTAAAAAAIAIAGVRLGTWHDPRDGWSRFALLIPWALGQQFALQTVFLREAQHATSTPAGILIAALAFATLHLPNPFLAAATFAGALAWCSMYNRHPHVVPLALSHALLTLAVLYAFDTHAIGGLRTGAAY